jgi:PAS domain S-box-containing protein
VSGSTGSDYGSADYLTLFYELFQGTSDAVFLVRLTDGAVVDANASFLQLIGCDRAQVVGQSMRGAPAWAKPSSWVTFLADLRERGRTEDRAFRMSNEAGQEFNVSVFGVVARWRGEDIAMGIAKVID